MRSFWFKAVKMPLEAVIACGLGGNGGITMLRYRLALVAAGILLLTAPSAWAFSLENVGCGGDGAKASDRSIRTSSRCSSVSSSKVHLIPFGGSNRYTAMALIIRRGAATTERASFICAPNPPPPRA